MLGIKISERTVSRILRGIRRPPSSQTWKTFLRNHLGQLVSVDFFTVPTIHLALGKQCPIERPIMSQGRIVELAEVGGLHHRYERLAA